MKIAVFHHRHWDQMNGAFVEVPSYATAEYIARTKGEPLTATRRDVDERLIDADGKVIIDLTPREIELLRQLAACDGQRSVLEGNVDRRPLQRMVIAGLMTSHTLNLSDTEHELTDLGRLALEQLA